MSFTSVKKKLNDYLKKSKDYENKIIGTIKKEGGDNFSFDDIIPNSSVLRQSSSFDIISPYQDNNEVDLANAVSDPATRVFYSHMSGSWQADSTPDSRSRSNSIYPNGARRRPSLQPGASLRSKKENGRHISEFTEQDFEKGGEVVVVNDDKKRDFERKASSGDDNNSDTYSDSGIIVTGYSQDTFSI